MIFVKNAWSYTAKEQPLTARNILMALITGMIIGLYDSLYGPGGGTIAMLLFTFLFHYDIRTRLRECKDGLDRLQLYRPHQLHPFGKRSLCHRHSLRRSNVLGNYIGAGFAVKNGAKIIRPVMICVVVVLIVKLLLGK